MLEDDIRRRLLGLARQALEARVRGEKPPPLPADLQVRSAGVFVTIDCHGELRGCLGTLEEGIHLAEAVTRLAAEVCHADYRFSPVTRGELQYVTIDLSVLTPRELLEDHTTIVIGRDGLIVEHGGRHGLLLPQVASEHGWDREMFLAQACAKAGLSHDAWRRGATVFRFRADVFGEGDSEIGEERREIREIGPKRES